MNLSVRCRSVFAAVLVVALSGCATRTEKAYQRLIDRLNALADTLATINTAEESRQALPIVEEKFQEATEAWREAIALRNGKVRASFVERMAQELPAAISKIQSQIERLQKTRGPAPEFWAIVTQRTIEHQLLVGATQPLPESTLKRLHQIEKFIKTYGNQKTVSLELNNLTGYLESEALERIRKAAPGAAMVRNRELEKLTIVLAPVEDYDAFLKSLDFGSVLFEDKPRA